MFSFDGEWVYEGLECPGDKMNMPEDKQIWISCNFFLSCKQETKNDISDIMLWKNIKCVMLILFFIQDTR